MLAGATAFDALCCRAARPECWDDAFSFERCCVAGSPGPPGGLLALLDPEPATAPVFVEIGTGDRETLAEYFLGAPAWRGVSVEPVCDLLARVPRRANYTQVCAAVAAADGEVELWTVDPAAVQRGDLPDWTRLISTTELEPLDGLDDVLSQEERYSSTLLRASLQRITVPAVTYPTLVARHLPPQQQVHVLKVDAEGLDTRILRQVEPLPRALLFEHKHETFEECAELLRSLYDRGYDCTVSFDDALCQLRP